jgi:hypothetical protein
VGAYHSLRDAGARPPKLAIWSGFTDISNTRCDLCRCTAVSDFSGYSPCYRRTMRQRTSLRPMPIGQAGMPSNAHAHVMTLIVTGSARMLCRCPDAPQQKSVGRTVAQPSAAPSLCPRREEFREVGDIAACGHGVGVVGAQHPCPVGQQLPVQAQRRGRVPAPAGPGCDVAAGDRVSGWSASSTWAWSGSNSWNRRSAA